MSLTRRKFLAAAALGLSACGLTLAGRTKAALADDAGARLEPLPGIGTGGLIRPPGAAAAGQFRARCTGCGACVGVCHAMKFDALAMAGFGAGRDAGSPHVGAMRDFPCGLCMECPKHCPTGALEPLAKEQVTMGMALIDFNLCFGWNGDVCLSCSKVCPLGGKVFEFNNGQWGNQPYINNNCVGCGLCVKYCPLGGSAIKVVTRDKYRELQHAYSAKFRGLLAMSHERRYELIYGSNLPEIMARGRIFERTYR